MKKVSSLVFLGLFLGSSITVNAITKKVELQDSTLCQETALYVMDALENTYGCYEDADEYNEDFQSLVDYCENN